jgi:phosphatidylinositol glycan class B
MLERILNKDSKELFKKLFIFSALIHLIAVFFSEGFHRPDEHLGMLRYVFEKLGVYPASELSWEYPAKIRNWVQPGIYYIIAKCLYLLQIKDPFIITFFLRLFTSVFSLYVLVEFSKYCRSFLKEDRSINIANLCFFSLWFYPFIHARTTAENFGMNVFALGLIILTKPLSKSLLNRHKLDLNLNVLKNNITLPVHISILGGFLIGMAVNFRIPLAPMPLFLILWLCFIAKVKVSNIFQILFGTILSVLFTMIFDSWGYGELTYSLWSYLYQEFTNNVSQGFGTSPWHYYIYKTFSKGVPPLSLFIIGAFSYLWIKRPGHILTWCTLPVFLLHSAIGHKELRYIFPLVIFIPVIISISYENLREKLNSKLIKGLIKVSIFVNLVFLLISSIKPAYTPINIYKFLYKNGEKIDELYTFNNLQRDILKVYLKKETPFIHITKETEIESAISKSKQSWFLVEKIKDFNYFENRNCSAQYSTYPKWFTDTFSKWLKRSKAWSIYKCESTK